MKTVYCANCGTRLNVCRKALPKQGKIVDIVEFHSCPDEPVEFDLTPIDLPNFHEVEGKNKFVQKLNDLAPLPSASSEMYDRREEAKPATVTTAPLQILNQLRQLREVDE